MKRFFGAVLRWILALGVAAVVWMVILSVLLAKLAIDSAPEAPVVPEDAILVLDLGINLVESPVSENPLESLMAELQDDSRHDVQARRLWDALDRAAEDPAIRGILLTGSLAGEGYGNSLAVLTEFRRALAAFQESGKPIWAHVANDGLGDYFIKSVADHVWMDPSASFQMRGLGSEMIYWAGAFDRIGIEVEVIRAGKYKSFGEPFAEESMSPEHREQLEVLLGSIWSDMRDAIAASREVEPAALDAVASDLGWILAEEALERSLVDELVTHDAFNERLIEAGAYAPESHAFASISLSRYLAADTAIGIEDILGSSSDAIAVVYAEGAIVDGEGDSDQVGGDRLVRLLREVRYDSAVKAVVLRVNSPGGSASASAKIATELALLNAEKPVVVSMGGYAASGGYYIAAPGEVIFAEPTTVTGSIGVISIIPNVKALAEQLSLNAERVETHPMASLFSPFRNLSEAERARFETFIEVTYEEFLQEVSTGRELSLDAVEAVAQGRVWAGNDALGRGLVDRLGGLEDAIAYAGDLAGLGDRFSVVDYPKAQTLEDFIMELLGGEVTAPRIELRAPWESTRGWAELAREGRFLQSLNDPRHLYAYSPVRVSW